MIKITTILITGFIDGILISFSHNFNTKTSKVQNTTIKSSKVYLLLCSAVHTVHTWRFDELWMERGCASKGFQFQIEYGRQGWVLRPEASEETNFTDIRIVDCTQLSSDDPILLHNKIQNSSKTKETAKVFSWFLPFHVLPQNCEIDFFMFSH